MNLITPLLCWDVASLQWGSHQQINEEFEVLYHMAAQHKWKINFYQTLFPKFDALVITQASQCIEWVSSGFEKMTGYSAEEAKGNHPTFLQGKNTSVETIQYVQTALQEKRQVTADIINYRKTGEEYLCHIEITPLFTATNKLSHFLAVEKEISKRIEINDPMKT